jgi:hypothetical protein
VIKIEEGGKQTGKNINKETEKGRRRENSKEKVRNRKINILVQMSGHT